MAEYVDIISMNLNDPGLRPNDGGFQTIDPGTYDFEIEKTATAQSNSGNNTLRVTGRVVGPEGSPMLNRTMSNSYVIKDDDFARGRMLNFLTASGAQIDDKGSFSREALVGLQFTADVEKRAGKTINKMGVEEEREFTSWVRERPLGTDVAGAQAQAPTAAAPAKAAQAPAATGNPPRRPAPPSGNGTQARR